MIKIYLFSNDIVKKSICLPENILSHIKKYKYDKDTYDCSYSAYCLLNKIGIDVLFDQNDVPYSLFSKFSISHSKNYVCVAVADKDIGVDIELIRPFNENLCKKVMNESEMNVFKRIKDKNKCFFEVWTKKEAYVKRKRVGLISFPKDIAVEGEIRSEEISGIMISISSSTKDTINYYLDEEVSSLFSK